MKRARVSILSDNADSWIQPFCRSLAAQLIDRGFVVDIYKDWNDLTKGDMLFILGCEKILPNDVLLLHNHNLIVHESDLPRGKGWSPLSWQIIGGKNKIPNTIDVETLKFPTRRSPMPETNVTVTDWLPD